MLREYSDCSDVPLSHIMEIESLEYHICQEVFKCVRDRVMQQKPVRYIGIAKRSCYAFIDREAARSWSEDIQKEEYEKGIGIQPGENPFCCGNYFEVSITQDEPPLCLTHNSLSYEVGGKPLLNLPFRVIDKHKTVHELLGDCGIWMDG